MTVHLQDSAADTGTGFPYASCNLQGLRKQAARLSLRGRIGWLALKLYGQAGTAAATLRSLLQQRRERFGANQHAKLVQIAGKTWFHLYAPAYPSKAFDNYMLGELQRVRPVSAAVPKPLHFLFLAVTSKCPMQCAHCFEWHNLNKPETLTDELLEQVIDRYIQQGTPQFHFGGGEPMLRIRTVEALIRKFAGQAEFFVLTSGFHATRDNLARLRDAGLTGLVVSLDHPDAGEHDAFRGKPGLYNAALQAMRDAREMGLVVAATICFRQELVRPDFLLRYAELVAANGAHFVQWLEPQAAGRWQDTEVKLSRESVETLERHYEQFNFDPAYRHLPVIVYPEYAKRRMGCVGAADRFHSIDAAGYVQACPFCQRRGLHVRDLLQGAASLDTLRITGCPAGTDA